MPKFRTPVLLAAVALLAVSLTSCASSKSKDSSGGAGNSAGSGGSTPATGPALTLGYINTETGALSFPEFTDGVNAALAYVNDHGGVNGSPIKLSQCFTDGSPESSLGCANKIVGDNPVGVLSGEDLGIDATIPVFDAAKLPSMSLPSLGVKSLTNPNNFQFAAAGNALDLAGLIEMKRAGAKKIAYVAPDLPTMRSRFSSNAQPAAKKLGIDASILAYSLAAPDYGAAVQTAIAAKDDGLVSLTTESGCLALATAVAAADFKGPVTYNTCLAFVDKLGTKAAGAILFSWLWLAADVDSAPADKRDQVKIYTDSLTTAGKAKLINNATAAEGFALVMNAVNILKTVPGTPTSAGLFDALRGLKDFDTFMGQKATCAPRPDPTQAACTASVLPYKVNAQGKLKLDGTGFLDLSEAH